jgi:hypothetical protein
VGIELCRKPVVVVTTSSRFGVRLASEDLQPINDTAAKAIANNVNIFLMWTLVLFRG